MSKVKIAFSGLEVSAEGTETTEQLLNMTSNVMAFLIDANYKAMAAHGVISAPIETDGEAPGADSAHLPRPQPLQGRMYG